MLKLIAAVFIMAATLCLLDGLYWSFAACTAAMMVCLLLASDG